MDTAIIQHGAVLISAGRISAVGRADALLAAHRDVAVHDAENAVLLPGLVNAHVHLELSNCVAGESCVGAFADWILGIRDRMNPHQEDFTEAVRRAVNAGILQCLRFGVTTVGDISQQVEITRPLLRAGPLRVVSFGEVLGLARLRERFEQLWPLAIDRKHESEFLRVGLSPHAPYTVDLPGFEQCVRYAQQTSTSLATHLAETAEETTFLTRHAGPFRDIWDKLGNWHDAVETYRGSPIEMAHAIGILALRSLLAHVNYCDDAEFELLARGRASVVYCPRTHRYFGHPAHRWREMLARGINVAVGTDSCASSPDLNLADELRLLRQMAPDVPASHLWEMATIRGARALSLESEVGSITPGKRGDLVAFETTSSNPLEEVLRSATTPREVWIAGRRI